MSNPGGLRERKKLETRAALAHAAVQLTLERGFDHVTVEEIAAAADVSARTFNNYFHNKEAAVLASAHDVVLQMCELFESRADDEPLWTSLREAVLAPLRTQQLDRARVIEMKLISHTPALLRHQLATFAQIETRFAAEVARRTGRSADADVYARLVASALTSVLRASSTFWFNAGPPVRLVDVVGQAFDYLTLGLPVAAEQT